jgi:hypothetical protein
MGRELVIAVHALVVVQDTLVEDLTDLGAGHAAGGTAS